MDFGEALGEIGGVVRKLRYFAMALPHSDAFFIKAYPLETTEAFCDGHVSAFAFFGGVPLSILYDNRRRLTSGNHAQQRHLRVTGCSGMPDRMLSE